MICNNCGRTFDEPAKAFQMHYEVDTMRERKYPICPYCYSEEIEESGSCPICGEAIPYTEDYCKRCSEDINQDLTRFIKSIQGLYSIDYEKAVEWLTYEIERRN